MNASHLSALVLVDPFGLKVGPIDRLDVPDIYAMPRAKLDALLYANPDRHRFEPGSCDDKTLERMARGWETMALVSWDSFFHNPKLKYRLAGVDLPSLVLRGESDGLVSRANAEAFASLIKGARFAEIEGAGHLPMIENPGETGDRVASFVSALRNLR
jgi:pimeloyl-ACP methyl ester carboxylesterase